MSWLYLSIAIFAEIIATSALKNAAGFTRLIPTAITLTGYTIAFFFLSLSLRSIPIGVAYAVWSGVGIVAIALIGLWFFGQHLDWAAYVGIGLIVAGVIVLNVFSRVGHG